MVMDEDFDAEDEAEDEEDEGLDEEEEEEVQESAKMKVLRIVAGMASKVKEVIGNLITTAGQVVVTILLGLTGQKDVNKQKVTSVSKLAKIQSFFSFNLLLRHIFWSGLQVSCFPL